jgi:hypothetical protein
VRRWQTLHLLLKTLPRKKLTPKSSSRSDATPPLPA